MNKKILNLIIGLIFLSLAGIIGVQYFWITNALKVKEAQFDRSVNDAMGNAVARLETRDDISYLRNHMVGDSIHMLVRAFSSDTVLALNNRLDSLLDADEFLHIPPPPPPLAQGPIAYRFHYHLENGQDQMDSVIEIPGSEYSGFTQDNISFSMEWRDDLDMKMDSFFNSGEFYFFDPGYPQPSQQDEWLKTKRLMQDQKPGKKTKPPVNRNNNQVIIHNSKLKEKTARIEVRQEINNLAGKAKKIKDVITRIATEIETRPRSVENRIDKTALERSLKKSLADKDIDIPFEYAVMAPANDTNHIPIRSAGFQNDYLSSKHRISLFPNDIFQRSELLLVYFPNHRTHLLKSVSFLMLSSVFFTFIIVITSLISIFIMLRQKKISDIKTDFINNMTHEFKTPIATISIAIDSINNPKVIDAPEKIRGYTKVIREENNRMNSRVEQVLQMALLDSRDFMLNPRVIDLNNLILKLTDNIRLQIESRDGTLEVNLCAENPRVEADEAHLSNVILNLLDNANKYSPGTPEISVKTRNEGSSIIITVEDKGIGMNTDTQHKIFDKFFRVTSGNIHNVKGFGLGLSYSKAIVMAHKGDIRVTSEPGQGSRFDIKLPLSVKSHGEVIN